jgi:hypothetical protein
MRRQLEECCPYCNTPVQFEDDRAADGAVWGWRDLCPHVAAIRAALTHTNWDGDEPPDEEELSFVSPSLASALGSNFSTAFPFSPDAFQGGSVPSARLDVDLEVETGHVFGSILFALEPGDVGDEVAARRLWSKHPVNQQGAASPEPAD